MICVKRAVIRMVSEQSRSRSGTGSDRRSIGSSTFK